MFFLVLKVRFWLQNPTKLRQSLRKGPTKRVFPTIDHDNAGPDDNIVTDDLCLSLIAKYIQLESVETTFDPFIW